MPERVHSARRDRRQRDVPDGTQRQPDTTAQRSPSFKSIGAVEPWGVLSTRPLGATVRLTPDRRVMIRNTAEYRSRDLSNSELLHRRKHHVLGLQRRFPFLE